MAPSSETSEKAGEDTGSTEVTQSESAVLTGESTTEKEGEAGTKGSIIPVVAVSVAVVAAIAAGVTLALKRKKTVN